MLQKRILVVDDEPSILKVLEMKFRNAGFEVFTASDGIEAFNIIERELPEVVITDNRMPKMSGVDLCVACQKIKEKKKFLFIMLSSYASASSKLDREWINSLSDTVFVQKPFSPRNILRIVSEYLEKN